MSAINFLTASGEDIRAAWTCDRNYPHPLWNYVAEIVIPSVATAAEAKVRGECARDIVSLREGYESVCAMWRERAERAEAERDAIDRAMQDVVAAQRKAKAALADAERKGGYEGKVDGFVDGANWLANRCVELGLFNVSFNPVPRGGIVSIFGQSARDAAKTHYAPTPARSVGYEGPIVVLELTEVSGGGQKIFVTPADARRIVSLAAQDGGSNA
jgi:hypothetical protein